MGWYGDYDRMCPNCKRKNAAIQFDNDMGGPLYLACPDCGLIMRCENVAYLVSNSYIDKNIIGKDPEEDLIFESLYELTDESKNENIIESDIYVS